MTSNALRVLEAFGIAHDTEFANAVKAMATPELRVKGALGDLHKTIDRALLGTY